MWPRGPLVHGEIQLWKYSKPGINELFRWFRMEYTDEVDIPDRREENLLFDWRSSSISGGLLWHVGTGIGSLSTISVITTYHGLISGLSPQSSFLDIATCPYKAKDNSWLFLGTSRKVRFPYTVDVMAIRWSKWGCYFKWEIIKYPYHDKPKISRNTYL